MIRKLDAETRPAQLDGADVVLARDAGVLVDAIVVGHHTTTDLELELAVGTGQLRRAFPLDLQV